MSQYHVPVLLNECITHLQIKPNGIYVDATLGGGGHSKEILKHLDHQGKLIVIDQDESARQNVPQDDRIIFVRENFKYAHRFIRLYKVKHVDGVLADLGVSSHQFNTPERGFSIRYNAALDMRMDKRTTLTAHKVLSTYSETQLHKIFEQYGEVSNAKTLANTIVTQRKQYSITTIEEFKLIIQSCIRANPNKYLAKVFQALRIEVNNELQAIIELIRNMYNYLNEDGRMCIITFHSIEDRIVKNEFKNIVKTNNQFEMNKKPIEPTEEEIKKNSRARSAKLRVLKKNKDLQN